MGKRDQVVECRGALIGNGVALWLLLVRLVGTVIVADRISAESLLLHERTATNVTPIVFTGFDVEIVHVVTGIHTLRGVCL